MIEWLQEFPGSRTVALTRDSDDGMPVPLWSDRFSDYAGKV
jgi:hypothetical protein